MKLPCVFLSLNHASDFYCQQKQDNNPCQTKYPVKNQQSVCNNHRKYTLRLSLGIQPKKLKKIIADEQWLRIYLKNSSNIGDGYNYQAAILLHSSAHRLQISAHSPQCSLSCLLHSAPQASHIAAQILQMSLALSLPKLISSAAA